MAERKTEQQQSHQGHQYTAAEHDAGEQGRPIPQPQPRLPAQAKAQGKHDHEQRDRNEELKHRKAAQGWEVWREARLSSSLCSASISRPRNTLRKVRITATTPS
jgi:hypothetical protein